MDDRIIGYVSLSRRVFEDPLWNEDRPKTPFEAWLWLIQAARFEKGQQKLLMGGKVVAWSRGQLPGSVRFLGDQWKWDKNKVDRFLKFLVGDGKISRDVDAASGQTIITLINYDKYNSGREGKRDSKKDAKNLNGRPYDENEGTTNGTPGENKRDSKKDSKRDAETQYSKGNEANDGTLNGTANGTPPGQPRDNTNKENKVKEEREETATAVSHSQEVKDKFKSFENWVAMNAPQVGKLKSPFTIEQFSKLKEKYDSEDIMAVLTAMENKKTLLKEYNSAYLTCDNWLKIRIGNGNGKIRNKIEPKVQPGKAAAMGAEIANNIRSSEPASRENTPTID